jgi:hypothetical protein
MVARAPTLHKTEENTFDEKYLWRLVLHPSGVLQRRHAPFSRSGRQTERLRDVDTSVSLHVASGGVSQRGPYF